MVGSIPPSPANLKGKNVKVIPEFPLYSISEDGKVWSTYSNKFLSSYINNDGYPCYKLHKNGVQYTQLIHRLLARVYKDLPSLDSDLEVDHKDTNILNYALENIQVLSKEDHRKKTLLDNGYTAYNKVCPTCSGYKDPGAIQCKGCSSLSQVKNKDVTAEQIEYWVSKYSWVRAAKEFGYSDNGLRKRYKSLTGKDPKTIKRG